MRTEFSVGTAARRSKFRIIEPGVRIKIAVACVTQYVAANPAVARTGSTGSDIFRHAKKIVRSESNTDIDSVWPVSNLACGGQQLNR